MQKLALIILALLAGITTFAQVQTSYSLNNEINKLLTADQKNELSQAQNNIKQGVEIKKQADALEKQAQDIMANIDLLKRSKRRKARKKYEQLHTQATEKYVEAYTKLILGHKKTYKVYLNNLAVLENKVPNDIKSKFQSYVNEAGKLYDQAQSLIREGYASEDKALKFKKYKQADEKLSQAIDFQKKAYKLYFDKKYHISARPQVTTHQISKPKTGKQNPTYNQPVNRPKSNQPVNTQKTTTPVTTQKKQTSYPPATKKQNTYTPPRQTYNQPRQNTQNPNQTRPSNTYNRTNNYRTSAANIYFRVQVAASRVRLSQAKLKNIYPGPVYMEYDPYDGKYKYLTAQKFSTYQAAKTFKLNCGVPGAFVVAYKNGQRVRDICTVVPCQR